MKNTTANEYFEWLVYIVCDERYSGPITYWKLLRTLFYVEFTYTIPMDKNRAEDGIGLRYRFYLETNEKSIDEPCSLLEMMVALAIRCENIMDDPDVGDRTGQWFWSMINSLGLGTMSDDNYYEAYVDNVIYRFLNREYFPDGKGGLFTIKNCDTDLRDVEIWHQLCWYLDSILGY